MSMGRKAIERRDFLIGLAALGAGAAIGVAQDTAPKGKKKAGKKAAGKAAEAIEVKSTLENLKTAFQGESNANAKYLAFAKKADEEGYGPVASLFRAAAKAEEIHFKNHAAVIEKMGGGKMKAEIKPIEVKSTRENLEAAIKGETYEFKVMYPAFLAKARTERNRDAIRTFNFATNAEKGHAELYTEALKNLETWKGANKEFFTCKECGNTVAKVDFEKCPVCKEPKDFYLAIA